MSVKTRDRIRAAWESERLFADAVASVADDPLPDELRRQAVEEIGQGYGETIAVAVVAAADGYFDSEYPATTRAWWLAVARELRGRTSQDDRALVRLGIRSLGRVIL